MSLPKFLTSDLRQQGKAGFFYRFFLRSRWGFHLQILWHLIGDWRRAKAGRYPAEEWIDTGRHVLELALACGGSLDVSGIAHLHNQKTPAVFVANHMSAYETYVLHWLISPHYGAFVFKKQLETMPFFGELLRSAKGIPVSRKNARQDLQDVLEIGSQFIADGRSIILFPTATRYQNFIPRKFSSLGAKLAKKAGVPLIPVALKTDFLANGDWVKDLGAVHPERTLRFRFGEAIPVVDSGREANDKAVSFITKTLAEWGVSIGS